MKNIVICIKLPSLCAFIVAIIFILIICFFSKNYVENIEKNEIKKTIENVQLIENSETNQNLKPIEKTNELNVIEEPKIELEEYKNMPMEVKGHKVVGKIEIPKIDLKAYILSETNKKALNVSATKLYGPKINQVGNFCIAGHNYNKMFGKIKNLEIKDNIILTDTYDNSITYEVYDIFQTSPKDVTCLNQNTEGDKELTLITCTKGAIKRVIVKAVEVYD